MTDISLLEYANDKQGDFSIQCVMIVMKLTIHGRELLQVRSTRVRGSLR